MPKASPGPLVQARPSGSHRRRRFLSHANVYCQAMVIVASNLLSGQLTSSSHPTRLRAALGPDVGHQSSLEHHRH
jgi:hypothetical protein